MNARVIMLGDSAWLVEWPGAEELDARIHEVHSLMHALHHAPDRPAGVSSMIAAFESLAVRYDPCVANGHVVREWIMEWLSKPAKPMGGAGELHEIPVCYGGRHGPDLQAVAEELGITTDEVVGIHSAAEYTVAMVGFAPGFPYLTGLPEKLDVPRLVTPRNRVDAGAVAIAGGQAGIYPCASPGGWRVLGRTGMRLFDPQRETAPSLLTPGDRVRFVPVDRLDSPPLDDAGFPHGGDIEVVEPGFATTVQDAGRPDFEHVGVSPGGALDREALRVANMLLGNPEGAAALELCVKGPTLRFERSTSVVLVGADASGGLRHGRSQAVAAGEVLDIGALIGGLRAVLAVAGGIDAPELMGSRATDVRAGFGGRALLAGGRLQFGDSGAPPPSCAGVSLARTHGRDLEIRFIDGPQANWFANDTRRRFEQVFFEVTTRQDRMGARLHGERLDLAEHREMRSQPVATGSIQIPPDGRPMVLFAERQTHGGYPQIGCVITADLPKLVRALPGTRIHFRRITLEDAWLVMRGARRDMQWLRAGLMCME
jgi:KipI family sensor histidine kinase inhibitor